VTGTADEAAFAATLARLLRESPAFSDGELDVWQIDVPGGLHRRSIVMALLPGQGRRTVLLTGHFDTVEVETYGPLKEVALDPDELAERLTDALQREPADSRAQLALADIASGSFIFGRGLLDMKAGLAAALAVMEAAAGKVDRVGNLLFIAVPDEEANSAGARHVAAVLALEAANRDLDIEAAINLDATTDDGDGAAAQVIALGSVGKVLPSALVVGQPVHVSNALRAIGAPVLAGALASAIEWLPALTPQTNEEIGGTPTLLGITDGRLAYDVTTPASVWMYWNVSLHRGSAGDVLDALKAAARTASDDLLSNLAERRTKISPGYPQMPDVAVVTFRELLDEAVASRKAFAEDFREFADALAAKGEDIPSQCRQLTENVWHASGRQGPAIVLGFASTPYLPVELGSDSASRRLEAAAEGAAEALSKLFGTPISVVRFFPGISDMSFLGKSQADALPVIASNTPAWMSAIRWPDQAGLGNIPIINIGPWGRDYHTRLERAHRRYTFEILPALVEEVVRRTLDGAS
jgi:arginine utilization protein RocB